MLSSAGDTANHICTLVFFLWEYHPEDGSNNGRNMLLRALWIKYIINIDVDFVGYLYITDLINAREMELIKIVYYVSIQMMDEFQEVYEFK